MRTIDSHPDGEINAKDSEWKNLRVWRDLNQDGEVQDGELFTLDELGITSLNLKDGLKKSSSNFTKNNGKKYKLADVNFKLDTIHSEYIDHIEIPEDYLSLPNLHGVGMLRDLREASVLSQELSYILQLYQNANTRQEQLDLLPKLMQEWAETNSNFNSNNLIFTAGGIIVSMTQDSTAISPNQAQRKAVMIDTNWEEYDNYIKAIERGPIVDSFLGTDSKTIYYWDMQMAKQTVKIINETYEKISQQLYQGLLLQTRLKEYVDEIEIIFTDNGIEFNFDKVEELFNQVYQTNPKKAFVDLAEFIIAGNLNFNWENSIELLRQYTETLRDNGMLDEYKTLLDKDTIEFFDNNKGSNGDDLLMSLNIANKTWVKLHGNGGNDIIIGNDTNDTLYGNAGDDVLYGNAGNDKLYGGSGNDVYVFAANFGQDMIVNYDASDNRHDVIRFTDNVADDFTFTRSANHLIITNGDNKINVHSYFNQDGNGAYRIDEIQFADGMTLDINNIKTIVQQSTENNDVLYAYSSGSLINGGLGNDTINGDSGDDVLYGDSGKDKLYGNKGNDALYGGDGNDVIYGGDGDDVIYGGYGNDKLNGGNGDDLYIFNKKDGRDTINDTAGCDTLKINASLNELWFSQNGQNLQITLIDSEDTITIQNNTNERYNIETIEIEDGRTLSYPEINQIIEMQNNFTYNPNISGNLNEQMIEFNQNNGIL